MTGMSSGSALLAALGIIAFWAAYCVLGEAVDRWFQNRQAAKLQDGVDETRIARLRSEGRDEH